MNFLNLIMFHVKVYSRNSYFLTLLLTTICSLILIDYTLSYMNEMMISDNLWIRAGIFGFWNLCVTAAGAINFQKHQQTLMYLINNRVSDWLSILSMLMAPASFGLLAFPLSYMICLVIGANNQPISLALVGGILSLYVGGVLLSVLIASFFLVTKNAIVYEALLTIPILMVSGLLPMPDIFSGLVNVGTYLIPISGPIKFLLTGASELMLPTVISLVISFVLVYLTFNRLIIFAKKTSLMEGV